MCRLRIRVDVSEILRFSRDVAIAFLIFKEFCVFNLVQ